MSRALLPTTSTEMEGAAADAFAAHLSFGVPIRDLWSPERCPAAFLPHLAWTLSVDTWRADWPESVKRTAIAESLAIHRIKGTPAAIRRALAALGFGDAAVSEGVDAPRYDASIDYDGAEQYGAPVHWATYRVYLSRPVTNEQAAEVREVLDLIAPARCDLAELNYVEASLLYDGAALFDGSYNYGVA
ncbi:MAG: phage tail protein I [Pseudomonadota bacterium]